jgi:hypothetical protein
MDHAITGTPTETVLYGALGPPSYNPHSAGTAAPAQSPAGSLLGGFGRRPRCLSYRPQWTVVQSLRVRYSPHLTQNVTGPR